MDLVDLVHCPRSGLERSDFVLCCKADIGLRLLTEMA